MRSCGEDDESVDARETQPFPSGAWWAPDDLPVREGCRVEPFVDGHHAMLSMCRAFLSARHYILLAGWDIHVELPLVRGDDLLFPGGTPGEDDGADALDPYALALWKARRLRVVDVLGFAAQRGVRVGVLLWDAYHMGSHLTNDPAQQQRALRAAGVECLLDDSSRRITHLTQSLHQKCAVVDGRVAFVGGIDLTVQAEGDYDRWDTHQHLCASPSRATTRRPAAHPWHDVHCRAEGAVVGDVLRNVAERWNEVAARHGVAAWPAGMASAAPASAGSATAQVIRTIPPHTYAFAPAGIATIKEAYLRALRQARHFVYIENQYLWTEQFLGLDSLRWGEPSQDMREVMEALAAAVERGAQVAITLPDHPNVGRHFTDGGVEWLRARAATGGAATRLHVFTLGNAVDDASLPGGTFYRPVYTHAKVAIVDDVWWTAGSANLNSRGMRTDAEINLSVADAAGARSLRALLWTEHLGRAADDVQGLEDPVAGLASLWELAEANRERVLGRQPLVGHILPYLTAADMGRLQLPVHEEHGWLDNLEGGSGALARHHAGRYI
jgi:phosphatidylserine/phosphatidylglycerophosphate/cardiolipin synthase-like enzyme